MAYKTGWMKKIINGVSTKVFAFAHAKTVYSDFTNKLTLEDFLQTKKLRFSQTNRILTIIEKSSRFLEIRKSRHRRSSLRGLPILIVVILIMIL